MNQNLIFDEEDSVFILDGQIDSFFTRKNYIVNTECYFSIVQEIAACHAAMCGVAITDLMKINLTWVILLQNIEIKKRLKWRDKWKAVTFVRKNKMPYLCDRRVVCYDESGDVVFKSDSVWAIVSLDEHKFVDHSYYDRFKERCDLFADFDNERIRKLDIKNSQYKMSNYKILWPKCDVNNHANNISYLCIAFECLEDLNEFDINKIQITYSKELKIGQVIDVISEKEDNCYKVIIGDNAYLKIYV